MSEQAKRIRDAVSNNLPAIAQAIQHAFDPLEQKLEELKPQMLENIKLLVPYIEILPRVVDWAICSELSAIGFVMLEKPDQEFCDGLSKASEGIKTVIKNNNDVEDILPLEDINNFVFSYLKNTNFRMTENAIEYLNEEINNDVLWQESIAAYREEKYALSALGFAALTDRLLTVYSGNSKTGITIRVNEISNRAKDRNNFGQGEADKYLLNTYQHIVDVYDLHRSFDDQEPPMLNRHWLMHGRRTIPVTQMDCIKVIHIMYATIATGKMGQSIPETGK